MAEQKYPRIYLRVTHFEFKKFKELKDNFKLSPREVLEYQTCPCERCKNTSITIFDKLDDPFTIPKSILKKKK